MAASTEAPAAMADGLALDERDATTESTTAQKRKADQDASSEHDDESSKRQRVDREEDLIADRPASRTATGPAELKARDPNTAGIGNGRPAFSRDEEKRRGKRLFGGLLSTLSQTTVSSQQLKRQEIERRQQDRVHRQRAEDDQKRAEKLARIGSVRRQEQAKWEEKVMKVRHSNMLDRAHSLRTKAEPHIYYRPWKLTQDQEAIVDDEVDHVKRIIQREVDEFEAHRGRGTQQPSRSRPSTARSERAVPQDADDSVQASVDAANDSPNHSHQNGQEKDPHDESGDIVMDGEEDMVIY